MFYTCSVSNGDVVKCSQRGKYEQNFNSNESIGIWKVTTNGLAKMTLEACCKPLWSYSSQLECIVCVCICVYCGELFNTVLE